MWKQKNFALGCAWFMPKCCHRRLRVPLCSFSVGACSILLTCGHSFNAVKQMTEARREKSPPQKRAIPPLRASMRMHSKSERPLPLISLLRRLYLQHNQLALILGTSIHITNFIEPRCCFDCHFRRCCFGFSNTLLWEPCAKLKVSIIQAEAQ